MTTADSDRKTPWHIWAVGTLTLLWNGSGAYTIVMAQAGRLANIDAAEAAYYAAQPLWFVVATDIALAAAIAAGVALLVRRRAAVWLFALSLSAIVVTNAYDLTAGSSRTLVNQGALAVTLLVATIAVLQLLYSWTMQRRALLQ